MEFWKLPDHELITLNSEVRGNDGSKREPHIIYGKRWKGGVKDFSKRRTEQPPQHIWDEAEFLQQLRAELGAAWQRIQAVRLYGQPARDTGQRQNIAEIFTPSDPEFRIRVHAAHDRLFKRGDWITIVRGEWLSSKDREQRWRQFVPHSVAFDSSLRGEPVSVAPAFRPIAPADKPIENCFRLVLSSGQSVLLDLGGPQCVINETSRDVAAFLSHAHPDHTGALRWALARRIPVFVSDTTLRVLGETGQLEGVSKDELAYLLAVSATTAIRCEGLAVKIHRVPHCIGSVAWSFCGSSTSLLYTGDIMLRSKAYGFNWHSSLNAIVAQLKGRVLVLLEASRAHAARSDEEALWPDLAMLPRDVVVVGENNPERLLFSYVQAYARVHQPRADSSPLFVLTAKARNLLEACWNEVFYAGAAHPDVPFVKSGNKWGVAESHALHWLDRADTGALTRLNRQRFWFVDKTELPRLPRFPSALVYDLRTKDSSPMKHLEPHPIERFEDRPGWTQHSHGVDVSAAVKDLQRLGAQVVLFHARPKAHKRFAAQWACSAELLEDEIRI